MEEKNMESMEREVSPQALESAQLLEELRDLRARELEWVFREDLDRIRRAFPQQAPDSIPELGDDFLKMNRRGYGVCRHPPGATAGNAASHGAGGRTKRLGSGFFWPGGGAPHDAPAGRGQSEKNRALPAPLVALANGKERRR